MTIMPMLLAVSISVAPSQANECATFPSMRSVHFALRDIFYDFAKADPEKDNWAGFVPLLAKVVEFQDTAPTQEVAHVEAQIVERFALYSFACEYDHLPVKANFDGRLESLRLLSQLSLVQSSTNTLFQLADWLAEAVPLDADDQTSGDELAEAFQRDNRMIYGGRRPPLYPGSVGNFNQCGPMWRACREKFRFRRLYNDRLPNFRKTALADMHEAIMNGYGDSTDDGRRAIWDEFCRRANASEGERRAAASAAAIFDSRRRKLWTFGIRQDLKM